MRAGDVYSWVRDAIKEGDFDIAARDSEASLAAIEEMVRSDELLASVLPIDYVSVRSKLAASRQPGLDELNQGIETYGSIKLHLAGGGVVDLTAFDYADGRLVALSGGDSYDSSEILRVVCPDEADDE